MDTKEVKQYIDKHYDELIELIKNESYDHIIIEMLNDLKYLLISESKDTNINLAILETFHNIQPQDNIIEKLNDLESLLTEGVEISISKIKLGFLNKHDKIIQRDKKWLSQNKKKILNLDYTEVELEVLSDYKVTFEQLLNRHNIFDKIFVNSENVENDLTDKLRRFEDKNADLKNGLDNYYRTGTSRREIGLRKIKGDEAKLAVENMVAYCESFLTGRQFLEEKMNTIIVAINDSSVQESLSPIDKLKILLEDKSEVADIENAAKDLKNPKSKSKNEDTKNDETETENKEDNTNDKPTKNKSDIEDIENTSDELEDADDEFEDSDNGEDIDDVENDGDDNADQQTDDSTPQRSIKDREVGMAVLLTITEERYFDYINILKGLVE